MLPITTNFLIKAHEAFDELGYHPSTLSFNFDSFFECAVKTLNHTADLEDARNAARMIQFVVKNFDKIKAKAIKYYSFWQSLKYEGNELISLVSDEEATGTYFLTNSFKSDYKTVFLCGYAFGESDIFPVKYKHGRFYFEDNDFNYSLRYSKMSSTKMVVLNKSDKKICVVVLSEDCDVFLENNQTPYDIVLYESGMGVYKKTYLHSIGNKEPDIEQLSAFICWDILDEKSQYGISRLEFFEEGGDLELFIIIAMSCFLLFRSYISSSNASFCATALVTSSWARKN